MGLILQGITKIVGGETHLSEINLEFASGSRNVILGRTLAGKTSLLRIMAGLDRPTSGKIIGGREGRHRSLGPQAQRGHGLPAVHQLPLDECLRQHRLPPETQRRVDKPEIDRRVREIAGILHLDALVGPVARRNSPGGSSNGPPLPGPWSKRRSLLLLDEPLVNLDYKLREELREELHGNLPGARRPSWCTPPPSPPKP